MLYIEEDLWPTRVDALIYTISHVSFCCIVEFVSHCLSVAVSFAAHVSQSLSHLSGYVRHCVVVSSYDWRCLVLAVSVYALHCSNSHWLCLCLCVCLPVSVYVSVSLSHFVSVFQSPSLCLSLCFCVTLFVCLCPCLSVSVSLSLSLFLCISVSLSLSLSMSLSMYLSMSLSRSA